MVVAAAVGMMEALTIEVTPAEEVVVAGEAVVAGLKLRFDIYYYGIWVLEILPEIIQ